MKRWMIMLLLFLLPCSLQAQTAPEITLDGAVKQEEWILRELPTGPNKSCNEKILSAINVSELAGTPKTIHVVRFVRSSPEQIRQTLQSLWSRNFSEALCYLGWDEGTNWSIQAVVEYEGGTKGQLLTDGYHLELQDAKGIYRFMRLKPLNP